ncbi:hypothetical protein [Micromonospora sp. NPDC093277]|uniref:hypothetical protein n=1 Tax=Micromonospora sp. NPDC093277 TaxID=3364291 RepID=UPI0037F9D44C
MVNRVTADRLMLVSVVDRWFYLQEPTFIGSGQTSCGISRVGARSCRDQLAT